MSDQTPKFITVNPFHFAQRRTEPPIAVPKPDYVKNDESTSKVHAAIDAAEKKLEEISAMIQKVKLVCRPLQTSLSLSLSLLTACIGTTHSISQYHDMADADDKDASNPQQQLRHQYATLSSNFMSHASFESGLGFILF